MKTTPPLTFYLQLVARRRVVSSFVSLVKRVSLSPWVHVVLSAPDNAPGACVGRHSAGSVSRCRKLVTTGLASGDLEDQKKIVEALSRGCRGAERWFFSFLFFFLMDRTFFKLFFSTRTKIDGTGIPPTVSVSACASGGSNLHGEIVGRFGDYNHGSPSRSLSLFLLPITIPDGRAITMEKNVLGTYK